MGLTTYPTNSPYMHGSCRFLFQRSAACRNQTQAQPFRPAPLISKNKHSHIPMLPFLGILTTQGANSMTLVVLQYTVPGASVSGEMILLTQSWTRECNLKKLTQSQSLVSTFCEIQNFNRTGNFTSGKRVRRNRNLY
jgi:hypothetical protein